MCIAQIKAILHHMDDQVAQIKAKVDIVTVIGERINLKKAGRNFTAVCPFHTEKTPSFVVSPELQMYKCFGCGESGDVYSFLEKYEGMDFYEALTYLAEKTGTKLVRRNAGQNDKQRLFDVNSLVVKLYHYLLITHPSGKKALEYLHVHRGLDMPTIRQFQIGYCPDIEYSLKALVTKNKATLAELDKLGLVYKRGSQVYDRFRGRVVFPLVDHRGNVAGFAGRVLPWSTTKLAKYINTPETPIYHKSDLLYGLNLTKSDIKAAKTVVLVEGELDMISAWKAGVKHVVAIKGSAVTHAQATLLSRFCDKVVLALDSDAAGSDATLRGMVECDKVGLEVAVADLGDFKDPDEMARSAPDEFAQAIKNAISLWDFVIEKIFAKYGEDGGAAKAKISREVTPVLASIDDKIVQAHYIKLVADRLGVETSAVSEQIQGTTKRFLPEKPQVAPKPNNKVPRKQALERSLLALGLRFDPQVVHAKVAAGGFATPVYRKIAEQVVRYTKSTAKFDPVKFSQLLPAELVAAFTELFILEEVSTTAQARAELVQVNLELTRIDLKEKLGILTAQLKELERTGDSGKSAKIEAEFAKVSKELNSLAKNP